MAVAQTPQAPSAHGEFPAPAGPDAPLALVLRTAGTNCDAETVEALRRAGARTERLHLAALGRDPKRLEEAALVVLPGGFSYGDYVAAGRLFGRELRVRLGDALERHVERGGYVLGICNGFQVLVELGLLEGPGPGGRPQRADERRLALTGNASGRFECRWIRLVNDNSRCAFLPPGEVWSAPVAHAEGRLVVRDAETLEALRERGQIAIRYAPLSGEPAAGEWPGYPDCPNGAVEAIAGLCDPTGRVLGLMPHPERNQRPWQHPRWNRLDPRREPDGARFFRRLLDTARAALPIAR